MVTFGRSRWVFWTQVDVVGRWSLGWSLQGQQSTIVSTEIQGVQWLQALLKRVERFIFVPVLLLRPYCKIAFASIALGGFDQRCLTLYLRR